MNLLFCIGKRRYEPFLAELALLYKYVMHRGLLNNELCRAIPEGVPTFLFTILVRVS